MHLELMVPALFRAHGAPSLPALELLLARGRSTHGEAGNPEAWLGNAFGLEEEDAPAGALTAFAGGIAPGAQTWLRADPVHLRADRDRLILVPSHAFSITAAEAEALAGALAPLLAGKFTLFPLQPGQWCLRIEREGESAGSSNAPIEIAGADVDPHLPPRQWHPLLTEIQMALYGHPVNTAREARGVPVINSVWLWGAGKLPAASGPWQSVSAEDPVAIGFGRLAGMRHRAPGAGAEEWLARAPEDGRHLVMLDSLRGAQALGDLAGVAQRLQALEEKWFAPLLAALKSGRLGMLTLHVPDAGASFEATRGDLRHFWRRPRSLNSYTVA
ncbi:MAG TPA: hypothetical protein VKS43_01240 [Burkholderiales bacterium]|nr:hypothetical protein [Burkholderiales bacterium]